MKILKLSIILLSILILPGVSKGQKIIFQEGFENTKVYSPISKKNNHENLFFAKNGSGYANLSSDAGQNSDFIIHGIDISEGVSFLTFWFNQNISSGYANGLKVYYRSDSISSWKLLANFTTSTKDWKQEKVFLPENSASYNIMFEGMGNKEDVILLDDIRVDFYEKAEAFSEGNKVYIDTLYNFSSAYLKVEVSEYQISGLPDLNNYKYLTPGVPVSCPPNAIMENEPNCYTNYKDTINSGCDSLPNRFIDLTGCNGVVCGKSGIYTYNSVSKRDFDWYRLVASGTSSITLKVVADFNIKVIVVNLIGGCNGIWIYAGQDLNSIAGDTAIINIPNITYSSDLYFWIAPNINQTVPCGSNYVLIYKTVPVISPATPVPSSSPACAPTQLNPVSPIPDYSFYWQSSSSGTSTANPASNAYPVTSSGTYYLRGNYNPLGCWTSSSSIFVNSSPAISATASPASVCLGNPSILTASGAVNYTWMPGNISGTQINVNPLNTTVYSVIATAAVCSSTATTTVTVNPKYHFTEDHFKCPGYSYNWQGQILTTAGTYTANYLSKGGCDSTYTLHLTDSPTGKTLQIKAFLEGLYSGGGLMNTVQGLNGAQFGNNITDQVKVELHNANSPYSTIFQESNVNLYTDGTISISDLSCNIEGLYYLVIKHRNSIETWSKAPVYFGPFSQINYDFTNSNLQAYGNNLRSTGNKYAIWCGDVNQDGVVDGSDLAAADNGSSIISTGYQPEDINGDGVVDGSDLAIIDNNSSNIVQVKRP